MEKDVLDILEELENGYDIIENNFFVEQEDFLGIGESIVELNELPTIDVPLSVKEFFGE